MDSQKKQNNKKTNNQNQNNKIKDHMFFTKVWYSMTKFENYPEMAAHGVPRALIYLAELIAIFSIILTILILSYVNKSIEESGQTENTSFIQRFEKTLDINLDNEQTNELNSFLSEYDSNSLKVAFVLASMISIFISFFIVTLMDILMLSIFGMITCYMAKIKIKYRAVFNMSVYAITISVILRLVYEALLLFADFKIKYFNIMYTSVAYICLAAAIFMIRSDLIKQQIELMKVIEEKKQKAIDDEQNERQKNEDEENKKQPKKNKKEKKEENDEVGSGEEQGSNA